MALYSFGSGGNHSLAVTLIQITQIVITAKYHRTDEPPDAWGFFGGEDTSRRVVATGFVDVSVLPCGSPSARRGA